jgi:hypothetical protein
MLGALDYRFQFRSCPRSAMSRTDRAEQSGRSEGRAKPERKKQSPRSGRDFLERRRRVAVPGHSNVRQIRVSDPNERDGRSDVAVPEDGTHSDRSADIFVGAWSLSWMPDDKAPEAWRISRTLSRGNGLLVNAAASWSAVALRRFSRGGTANPRPRVPQDRKPTCPHAFSPFPVRLPRCLLF